MKFRPLADRIVVKPADPEKISKGGIIIPDNAQQKSLEGTVVAVGPGNLRKGRLVPVDVKVGDVIFFGRYAGLDIKIENVDHVLINEDDVLGVREVTP